MRNIIILLLLVIGILGTLLYISIRRIDNYQLNSKNTRTLNITDVSELNSKDIPKENCKNLELIFLNNPFELDTSYRVTFGFSNIKVLDSPFFIKNNICVPDSLIGKNLGPGLKLIKDDIVYSMGDKYEFQIGPNDKYIYAFFNNYAGENTNYALIFASNKLIYTP